MDRDLSDFANIITIDTEQNNVFNRFEAKQGLIIKLWFNSSILQPASSNLINISKINESKELSLREIVALTTKGHGFYSCNWRDKCETKNAPALNRVLNAIVVNIILLRVQTSNTIFIHIFLFFFFNNL